MVEELISLSMQVLEQWDQEVYSKLTAENRECSNNLLLFANLSSGKSLKVRIQHSFSSSLSKSEREIAETVVSFASVLRLNSGIKIGEFHSQEVLQKIDFLKKMAALSFELVLELKISPSLRKIAVSIQLKVEKHFPLGFLEKNRAGFTNLGSNVTAALSKISSSKSILPASFGLSLARNSEVLLGIDFFSPGPKKSLLAFLNAMFPEAGRKAEPLVSGIAASAVAIEAKSEGNQWLEWELLYDRKKGMMDEAESQALKNQQAKFILQNVELQAKRKRAALAFSEGAVSFGVKFQGIKAGLGSPEPGEIEERSELYR